MVTINVEPVSKEKFVDLDKDKDDSMTSQPENNIQITKNWKHYHQKLNNTANWKITVN